MKIIIYSMDIDQWGKIVVTINNREDFEKAAGYVRDYIWAEVIDTEGADPGLVKSAQEMVDGYRSHPDAVLIKHMHEIIANALLSCRHEVKGTRNE